MTLTGISCAALYRARVPRIRRGCPASGGAPWAGLAFCDPRPCSGSLHPPQAAVACAAIPVRRPKPHGKRASPTDLTEISRGHALFWGYPVKSILPLTRTGNLPGSLFFTHRLLWNNGSGICQLFLYRINYSSANSTTNLASVAAMASWSLFSKFVFCSILMTWYFTVDGSMPSSFAISL